MRSLALGLALGWAMLGPARTARACCEYGGLAVAVVAGGVGGTALGLATLGVLGMDLTYALRGRAQPNDLAYASLALGIADIGMGAGLMFVDWEPMLGIGLGLVAAGVLLITDGVIAFASGTEEARAPPRGGAVRVSPVGLAVTF